MKRWGVVALALAILSPGVARADSIAIPFAPPTDRALTYVIEQHRPIEGRDSRFTATRDLRFERAGEGYILHATLRAVDSDAPASGAEPFAAALTPLVGVALHFRLDPSGRIVALDDMDGVWTRVQSGLDNMLAGFAPDTPRHRAARSVQALFAGLSSEGRLSLLAGEFQPLFLFATSGVEDGAGRGVRTMAGSPLGRPVPVAGELRITAQTPDALDMTENLAGEGIGVTLHYHLSRTTGLVESQHRTLTVGARTLTETRRLTGG